MKIYFYLTPAKRRAAARFLVDSTAWVVAVLALFIVLILPIAYGYHRENRFAEPDEHLFLGGTLLGLLGVRVLLLCHYPHRYTSFRSVQGWGVAFVVGIAGAHATTHIMDLWRVVELLLACWLWPSVVAVAAQGPARPWLTTALVLAALGQSGLVGYQFFTTEHRSLLVTGTFFNAGSLGNYLALAVPWLLSLAQRAYQRMRRSLPSRRAGWRFYGYLLALGLVLSALLVTGARAAWLGAVAGSGLVLGRQGWRRIFAYGRQRWQGGLGRRLGTLAFGVAGSSAALWVLLRFKEASVYGRWQIYTIGATLFAQHPLGGIGWGRVASQFNEQQAQYFATHTVPVTKQLLATDTYCLFNSLLELSVEAGIAGSAAWLAGLVCLGRLCWRRYQQAWPAEAVGAAGALLSVGVSSLFSYPLQVLPIACQAGVMLAYLPAPGCLTTAATISWKRWALSSGVLFVLAGQLLYQELQRWQALRLWQRAAVLARQNQFSQALPLYERAYPVLGTHGAFLYNYGVEAGLAGQATRSISLLETTRPYYTSAALYTYLGQAYESTRHYQQAKWCYQHASYMAPAYFYPKYKLFELYWLLQQHRLAAAIGQKLLAYPVKIDNEQTRQIKYRVEQLLRTDSVSRNK